MNLIVKTPADLEAERAQSSRDADRARASACLAETDWMVVRQAETGKPVPPHILHARAEARAILSA